MTRDQEKHLQGIKNRFDDEVDTKYRAGQVEHGGDLFRKPGMMRNLRAEVLDLVVYGDTLTEQLNGIIAALDEVLNRMVLGDVLAEDLLAVRNRLDGIVFGKVD